MFKLSEMLGQRGGSDAFGQRAVKNIGIRTDIGQTFAETGTTSRYGVSFCWRRSEMPCGVTACELCVKLVPSCPCTNMQLSCLVNDTVYM